VQHVTPDAVGDGTVPPLSRRQRRTFAVVGYKGQPPLGFITLDNMLSALVGEIRDEFRQQPQ
jgi:CBS domain containing-hemolysin-like protein